MHRDSPRASCPGRMPAVSRRRRLPPVAQPPANEEHWRTGLKTRKGVEAPAVQLASNLRPREPAALAKGPSASSPGHTNTPPAVRPSFEIERADMPQRTKINPQISVPKTKENKSRFPPRTTVVFRAPRCPGPPPRDRLPPPDEETAESLTEFLSSQGSPWALPPDCSPADQQLRELAVQSPREIRRRFIFSYFKSLRIVNKGVTEIDVDLLKFPNLEELILSANRIGKINSANLPPTLKVLELCGNAVDGLRDLCAPPPPLLQHLGLGRNGQLGSSEEQYLTDTFWPNLVSLDLSYNRFTSLLSLLSKLLTLKKLRILVLQGNPFALLPGYRGFAIDSLPKLCTLDDILITLDERHAFLELASSPELLRHSTKMTVSVGKLRGIPNPVGPEEPGSGPEAPVITYSYYVTYEFAKGEKTEEKEVIRVQVSQHSPTSAAPNVDSAAAPEGGRGHDSTAADAADKLEPPPECANVHSTPRKPWAETIECDYKKEHLTRDMVALKAYLLAGTTVAVVEEKIVSWPINVTPDESPAKKGKGKKDKQKAEKEKAKDAGKGGNKKKKKSPSPELRSDPPVLKTLGSGQVSLESLLAGESLVETVCDFGVLITELRIPSPSPKEKDSKKGAKKDKKDKKPKAGTEGTASRKTPPSAKGKGRKKDSPEGGDLPLSQPVPLTVEFQMQHTKWTSASQILM